MITLITIPALPKMATNELLKCTFFAIAMDFIILIAYINL